MPGTLALELTLSFKASFRMNVLFLFICLPFYLSINLCVVYMCVHMC